MTKDDVSITYENNIFYCTKDNTKWISIDGENWYGEERRIKELEQQIEKMKCCANCKFKDCDKSNRYQTCWYCTNKDKWKLKGE